MSQKEKTTSRYFKDLVKAIPLVLAEVEYSDEKCLILGRAFFEVLGLKEKYDKERAKQTASILHK